LVTQTHNLLYVAVVWCTSEVTTAIW